MGPATMANSPLTVILVEDAPDLRMLARGVLASAGFAVHDFATGEDAVAFAIACDCAFDVVIADLDLNASPGMSGSQALELLALLLPEGAKRVFVLWSGS